MSSPLILAMFVRRSIIRSTGCTSGINPIRRGVRTLGSGASGGARDVLQVIEWAETERGERSYQLFVEEPIGEGNVVTGVRLVRLAGEDPTRVSEGATISFSRE